MPYPHNSPQAEAANSSSHLNSSTHKFAKAFSEAQSITLERARFGLLWPLFEFWKDRLGRPMKIVHELIDPIVADAVAKSKVLDESVGDELIMKRRCWKIWLIRQMVIVQKSLFSSEIFYLTRQM
jgi:hypothetical protein